MRRAILLTGFNNWGKTWHVYSLFERKRFLYGKAYAIPGVNTKFTVESHSNDDYDSTEYIDVLQARLDEAPEDGKDLFSVLCPSREDSNNSRNILQGEPFSKFDEVHLILLQYKWDMHAELRVLDIEKYLALPNVMFFTADESPAKRQAQILHYLQSLYP